MAKQIIKTEEYGIPPSIKDYRQDFNVPDTIIDEYIWYYIQLKKRIQEIEEDYQKLPSYKKRLKEMEEKGF